MPAESKGETKYFYILLSLVMATAALFFYSLLGDKAIYAEPASYNNMTLSSPAFNNSERIPSIYSCDGSNLNPPLEFNDVPANAKSLTLIMEDPDVPKGILESGVFDHWLTFNIPAYVKGVGISQTLAGIYGANSRGEAKYTGPCPPDREHRYIFTLYALDAKLDLKEGVKKEEILKAMTGHVISQSQLIGRYNRPSNNPASARK